jgi:exodeoxyribonuclease V alpha subunit
MDQRKKRAVNLQNSTNPLGAEMEQLSLEESILRPRSGASPDAPAFSPVIIGEIKRIFPVDEDKGECIVELRSCSDQKRFFVKVTRPSLRIGLQLSFEVEFLGSRESSIEVPLQAKWMTTEEPQSTVALRRFLKSGVLPSQGNKTIRTIAKHLKGCFFSILSDTPEKLLDIPGVGKKRQLQILKDWRSYSTLREVEEFLFSNHLPLKWAPSLVSHYQEQSLEVLTKAPYSVLLNEDFDFLLIDSFALKIGFPKDALVRVGAGLNYLLKKHVAQGHCAFPEAQLMSETESFLAVSKSLVEDALEAELIQESLSLETIDNIACIYPYELWKAEREAASRLQLIHTEVGPTAYLSPHKVVNWAQTILNIRLAPKQQDAIQTVLSSPLTIITGGPGTGKTTLIRALTTILDLQHSRFALCSVTGRAAQRLTEATQVTATTIHRLLRFDPLTGGFLHGSAYPLDLDLVLIDEASMVDLKLLDALLRALPVGCQLVLVGDADQLPSVGPGTILRSLIASQCFPVVILTDIFRQVQDSAIRANAEKINAGQMPGPMPRSLRDFDYIPVSSSEAAREVILDLLKNVIPNRFGVLDAAQTQILTPMNRGAAGSQQLNEDLRDLFTLEDGLQIRDAQKSFRVGDKVMILKNDYNKSVFNGDVGFIRTLDPRLRLIEVEVGARRVPFSFDELDALTLAYVVSIHKSQGSEYKIVIVLLTKEHQSLAQRNLIYTAVTRGKEHVFLVAEPPVLKKAVETVEFRWQKLTELLRASTPVF